MEVMHSLCLVLILAAVLAVGESYHGFVYPRVYNNMTDEEALDKARLLLSQYPLTDGHNDLPHQIRKRVNNQLATIDLDGDMSAQWGLSHTDIPRLRDGQVGAQFWVSFVRCNKNNKDAVRASIEQIDLIHMMIEKYPNDFQYAETADELEAAFANGKIASLIAVESGHGIDSSLGTLRMMYKMGARYLGLTHNCNTHWSSNNLDDNLPVPPTEGLTDFGKKVIRELNRLGMMVDISHVSKATMIDTLQETQAPVIFSHSNAWTLCEHPRNVQDDVLQSLTANGGVIMVTFVSGFINCFPSNHTVDNIPLMADHIEHIRDVAGIDHVGIGGDYDGTDNVPADLNDVSRYPYLIAELVKRGWSDLDVEKLAGRNIVRVLRAVEQVRDNMTGTPPIEDWIPPEDIDDAGCRTDEIDPDPRIDDHNEIWQ